MRSLTLTLLTLSFPLSAVAAPTTTPDTATPDTAAGIKDLNPGAQVVFAFVAKHNDVRKKADEDFSARLQRARLAGAFSVAAGDWLDPGLASAAGLEGVFDELVAKTEAFADIDYNDGAAVRGKTAELLTAIPLFRAVVAEGSRLELRASLTESLDRFELILDPPYAYGRSPKKIAGYASAGLGVMTLMAGVTALLNPYEPSSNFALTASVTGALLGASGAALIFLDDQR